MKKLTGLVLIAALLFCSAPAFASLEGYRKTISPTLATTITHPLTRGVQCGVAGDYDFYMDGSWILLKGLLAGTIYELRVTGARDADDSDAEAGDLMLLY